MESCPQLKVEKWDHRHWAVYDGPELICVTVYKKGALEVKRRLESVISLRIAIEASRSFVAAANLGSASSLPIMAFRSLTTA